MIRTALLTGFSSTLACAPALGTSQLSVAEALWVPVDTEVPETAVLVAAPVMMEEAVREVVYTDPGELPCLRVAGQALPLRHTAVRAHLRGDAAEVAVRQRFVNDGPAALEAIYTFPLPENSAVASMRMVIGERVIVSEVREREAAREVYDSARAAGHTAALLEQERPNIFTQSIANIAPGEAIEVEIHYLQTLSYDAGEYEFVFPTVVGERYAPGDRVADASRISPPVLGHGQRSGHDLTIEVVAEAGSPITSWAAPGHAVEARAHGGALQVKLARRDEIANRDFVLRYRSAAAQPAARLFVGPSGAASGHFMLVAEPPRVDVDARVGARELVFVVDVSGSMTGPPLALAKSVMRQALAGVRPVDTFDVVVFAGHTARLFDEPRPANADNLRRATDFIDGLSAGGGTEMADAVVASLRAPVADGRHRYVFFLTDGYIGEEAEIASGARDLIAAQRRLQRRARVFAVGIGAAPNSALISGLARAGDGLPLYVRRPADIARAVNGFQRMIDAPILTDVSVDWGGMAVTGVYPHAVPDLFASHPLVMHGEFRGPAPRQLELRGTIDGRAVTVPVVVTAMAERSDVLSTLWARARVAALELGAATGEADSAEARAQILAVGLRHHIVTAYTSFVAVDSSRRLVGPQETVAVPVAPVEGMYGPRSIPAGGTSRDFTAVLDLAPTASRDAAGVRLAGASGAESRYVVDGGEALARTRVPEAIRHLERQAHASAPGPAVHGVRVEPYARARLRSLDMAPGQARDGVRTALTGEMERLSRCFVAAPRASYRLRRTVHVALGFAAAGAWLRLDGPGTGDPALAACLRERLTPLFAARLDAHAGVAFALTVTMQY